MLCLQMARVPVAVAVPEEAEGSAVQYLLVSGWQLAANFESGNTRGPIRGLCLNCAEMAWHTSYPQGRRKALQHSSE